MNERYVQQLCGRRSCELRDRSAAILRWKSTVAVTLQLRDCEIIVCVIWGFDRDLLCLWPVTQVRFFCSVWSSDGARTGLHCAGVHIHRRDPRWRARPRSSFSPSPSHQWGNLLHMVTRCQSGRSIRNYFWTELRADWIIISWTESNWNFSLNWTLEPSFGLELELKVSYFYLHIEFIYLNVIWNDCGPLWLCIWRYFLACKGRKKELTQEEK